MDQQLELQLVRLGIDYAWKGLPFYQVAKSACVSETTLRKLYHKYLGMSPQKYINKIKLHRVHTMLRTTDYTITQLGEIVGYTNISKLSSAFRKEYGISPSACRNMAKKTVLE